MNKCIWNKLFVIEVVYTHPFQKPIFQLLLVINFFASVETEDGELNYVSKTKDQKVRVSSQSLKWTLRSVLTKQCGVVPGMVDRWHHLVLLYLDNPLFPR